MKTAKQMVPNLNIRLISCVTRKSIINTKVTNIIRRNKENDSMVILLLHPNVSIQLINVNRWWYKKEWKDVLQLTSQRS